ncbi:hypothetical protein D3C85_1118970 [compost metagenome]
MQDNATITYGVAFGFGGEFGVVFGVSEWDGERHIGAAAKGINAFGIEVENAGTYGEFIDVDQFATKFAIAG